MPIHKGELGPPGCLALPGGPVGPPTRGDATSNVDEKSGVEEGAWGPLAREGWLYSDKLFAADPTQWWRQGSPRRGHRSPTGGLR